MLDARRRLILAALMSAVMVFMVTLVATLINLGPHADFVLQWMKAYVIAWPVAAMTAFLVMPVARRVTERIVEKFEGDV